VSDAKKRQEAVDLLAQFAPGEVMSEARALAEQLEREERVRGYMARRPLLIVGAAMAAMLLSGAIVATLLLLALPPAVSLAPWLRLPVVVAGGLLWLGATMALMLPLLSRLQRTALADAPGSLEPRPIDVPPDSAIAGDLPGADFHDAYVIPLEYGKRTALELYLDVVARTPAWVIFLMAVRNRAVAFFGLKNLGRLGDGVKAPADYRLGDRVGIFTLLSLDEDEIILGDADKHLEVKLSVRKLLQEGKPFVAVTTVVHIHNLLGRIYMLFVAPMHKLIAPAVLRRAADPAAR